MAGKDKAAEVADDNKIDHYVKQGVIASGKHAQVMEVLEENTTNRFALKILLADAMLDSGQVSILKFEGKVAQSLDHPNIIKWFATVHRKTNIYLVLELFKALNVKNFIANDATGVQIRLRKLIDCTCLALQHMHEKGWVHLDVKPDNILLNRSSEVRLIDFSLTQKMKGALSKLLGGNRGDIGGTLTYIAPETIRKENPSPQTDIYSLGITIYECLTGTTPLKGSTPKDLLMKHLSTIPAPPSDFNKNVTPEMDRMVLRMLAKKPKDRQKNMQEVMSEFRNIQIFKEDPEVIMERRVQEAKDNENKQSLGKRLDSRTDHTRTEIAKTDPEMAKQLAAAASPPTQARASVPDPKKKESPAPAPKLKPAAAQPPRPPMPMPMQQPMMQQPMMQQPMMQQPMMQPSMMPMQQPMMPGYPQQPQYAPMPGMPGGYMPMPGYPMQQMPMPGQQPMPGYPPGQGYPMMPNAGQMPPTPVGASPQMPPPAAPQPPPAQPVPARPVPRVIQRPAPPPVPTEAADLPTMDELPDVM